MQTAWQALRGPAAVVGVGVTRRWASRNAAWTFEWLDGLRLFKQGKLRYVENMDQGKPYYFKVTEDNEPIEDSSTFRVPFNPDAVSKWNWSEDGFTWSAPNSPKWVRHNDGHSVFYVCGNRTEWNPTPPMPPKAKGAIPPPPPKPKVAPPAQSGEKKLSQTGQLRRKYGPNNGKLRPQRKQEVKQLQEKHYYGVKPCPINTQTTLPIGSYVYFIHDFKVLLHRIGQHPGSAARLDAKSTSNLRMHFMDRMQIVRWSRKHVPEHTPLVLLESARHVDAKDKKGRQPPIVPYSVWVPANVIVQPTGYHAPALRDMLCYYCDHVSKDSVSFNRHLKEKHNESYRKCPKCSVLVPLDFIAEHDLVCEASPHLLEGKAASRAPEGAPASTTGGAEESNTTVKAANA